MECTFITGEHPSFARVQKHKAAVADISRHTALNEGLAAIARLAVLEALAAGKANASSPGTEDAYDWAANLPSEAALGTPSPVRAKSTRQHQPQPHGRGDAYDWAANLPSEKDFDR